MWVPTVAVLGVDDAVSVFTPDVASVPEQEQVVTAFWYSTAGEHPAEAVGATVSIVRVLFVLQSLFPMESLQ